MPNKKEERSDGGCVSGTTAPATEVSMLPGAISCPDAITMVTHVSNRCHHTRNRCDDVSNRRDHTSNRRHIVPAPHQ